MNQKCEATPLHKYWIMVRWVHFANMVYCAFVRIWCFERIALYRYNARKGVTMIRVPRGAHYTAIKTDWIILKQYLYINVNRSPFISGGAADLKTLQFFNLTPWGLYYSFMVVINKYWFIVVLQIYVVSQ